MLFKICWKQFKNALLKHIQILKMILRNYIFQIWKNNLWKWFEIVFALALCIIMHILIILRNYNNEAIYVILFLWKFIQSISYLFFFIRIWIWKEKMFILHIFFDSPYWSGFEILELGKKDAFTESYKEWNNKIIESLSEEFPYKNTKC